MSKIALKDTTNKQKALSKLGRNYFFLLRMRFGYRKYGMRQKTMEREQDTDAAVALPAPFEEFPGGRWIPGLLTVHWTQQG